MFDLLIRHGDIIDGSGAPSRRSDIGITGSQIEAIGNLEKAESKDVVSAEGMIVCPGFIDTHSHSDAYLLIDPRAVSKVTQGITTEICGNCGSSAAPRLGLARLPSDWEDKPLPGRWETVAEYRALFDRIRPAVNAVLLIGHNTLRAGVMGYVDRQATEAELLEMGRRLEKALAEGGRGLSTGLIYPPGLFAASGEIQSLAAVAARHGGVYTSHMRSEGKNLLAALEETVAVGRMTGVRLQISHLKTSGKSNWPLIDRALEIIRQARAEGVAVGADRYPYTASCTDLDVVFPSWAEEGGREAIMNRLRDPAVRSRLRSDILASMPDESWGTITIGSTGHPSLFHFRGQPLSTVAEALHLEPVDALLHIVERDELRTSAFFSGMSEENLWRILAEPYVMVGSDASLRAPDGPLSHDFPHPRAYGSFPRFLKAVLDGRSVSLPEAIRKMTSLPAQHFGLSDRGLIQRGKAADLTIFNPRTLADVATYAAPHQTARGIEHVIVNGKPVMKNGLMTGVHNGRFL